MNLKWVRSTLSALGVWLGDMVIKRVERPKCRVEIVPKRGNGVYLVKLGEILRC